MDMGKILNRNQLLSLVLCVIPAAELFLLLDYTVVYSGGMLPLYAPVFVIPLTMLVLFVFFRGKWKKVLLLAVAMPVIICTVAGLGYMGWKSFSRNAVYENPDSGKHQLYGDRNVMAIVPHQDDELNILSGVMEEYVRYGSEIQVVFVTNGDYNLPAETRMREALAVCTAIGIPEDHVVFLGYGNEWEKGKPHIYNSDPDTVCTSYGGKTAVYGTGVHSAYREGSAYTLRNLEQDMKDIILENRPDILFCSDYDHHIDHKATSLLFEKVMGNILKENPDYVPVVYKGYAYGTAWESVPDYYADNVLSTQNPFDEPYHQRPVIYDWEDRVRLPIAGDTLSRSMVGAPAYQLMALYHSQGAVGFADCVINGDRVFWQRHTASMMLHADVTASSGDAKLLHNFMLVDNSDLVDQGHLPYDGVWVPDQADTSKTVSVTLAEESDLASIILYDHPSPEHNVKNAVISFDDGTIMETGPLDPDGAATYIAIDKVRISAFSVSLLEIDGKLAGLSEIEVLQVVPKADGRFIKLMDTEGNFVYDYLTMPDGCAEFVPYLHGDLPKVTADQYSVETAWGTGTAEFDGETIRVYCPDGETMVLNVTCNEAGVSDSIVVRNPGALARWWSDFWVSIERDIYSRLVKSDGGMIYRLNWYRIWERVSYLIRHI